MRITLLSLFPDYFVQPLNFSILKRAQEKGILQIELLDIRDFAEGKHRKVDDRPFGGGPGMVLMPGPVVKAIRSVKGPGSRVVYLSPQGEKLTAKKCEHLATCDHLILLCGHYEGIDERAIQSEVDEEVSIGDYVLTSGCPAAVVLVDAVARFVPGVIGHPEAAAQDTFQEGIFEGPQYTHPVLFEEEMVPAVLRGGNHAEIAKWRKQEALKKTKRVRPDLLQEKE
ncbi:MAG: tRNA ((1)-)-methyltransferase [Chlamydiota bacterium]|jgi:tRNA (guanine37-N1)-methyltransferase